MKFQSITQKVRCTVLQTAIAAFLGLICGACNGDIFVEPVPDIVDSITVPGYEGTVTLRIQKKGLRSVWFNNDYTWRTSTEYYDHYGNQLYSPSDIDAVKKAIYYSNMFAVEFSLNGDEVSITVLDNAYLNGMEMSVGLDYGHAVKTVTINIGGGRPHVINNLAYYTNALELGTASARGMRENVINDTDQELRMEIYPYRDAKSKLTLTPDDEDFWSGGSAGKAQVPFYESGEWVVLRPILTDATIGQTTYFTSPYVDADEKAVVVVPPNSVMRVETTIIYATFETRYIADVQLPNFDVPWLVNGTYRFMQPIDYSIETTLLDI